MREAVSLNGVVLQAQPVGEYDRRLVILTQERGKITVFAHGVRRAKTSPLIAASNPFVFAVFHLYEGRDAYTLISADAVDYFSEIAQILPGVWYGYYFLEFASYYAREGVEAVDTVNLLYVALKAVLKEIMPVELIRAVYELRLMTINGEYAVPEPSEIADGGAYAAVVHTVSCPIGKLFSFELAEAAEKVFLDYVRSILKRTVDKTFKSLDVIEEMR